MKQTSEVINEFNRKLKENLLKKVDSEPFTNVFFTDVRDFDKPIKYYQNGK